MKALPFALWLLLFSTSTHAAPREEWFHNLSLESAVANSDLILAAQVTEMTEIKLMRGGKGESAMFQYKFKPAHVLKGVFARDELSLGSTELGLYRSDEMKQIQQGAFLLLFLGRSETGYRSTGPQNGAPGQSMPPLRGADDPLLEAVRTLLAANAERDRGRRVSLLLEPLLKAEGAGAVALLESLRRRPLLAAQDAAVAGAVTRHLTSASPAVRQAAAHTLRAILEADYLEHAPLREAAVAKSIEALQLPDRHTFARAAILRTLGAAGTAAAKSNEAMRQLIPPPGVEGVLNTTERAARLRALGDLKVDRGDLEPRFYEVPLDDQGEYSSAAEYALARVHSERAAALLRWRFDLKLAAGLGGRLEIAALAHLPPERAIPVLVEVSKLALNADEKTALAETCHQLAREQRDARMVEPVSGLLGPDHRSRGAAIATLLLIDNSQAAKALQPHLREEQNLSRKLQIAELLGRHGIQDGYPFAMEHVSESSLLELAVAALAAIQEPQTVPRLREILATSNDVGWNTAAVRGLGAMGAQEMAPQFLTLIADLRHPLAPAALLALADLGEVKALPKVREGIDSRNDEIVTAAARAAGKLLARPGGEDENLRAKLRALLADPDAAPGARSAALEALLALQDARLEPALAKVVREAKLEHSELLQRIEELLRERKVKL